MNAYELAKQLEERHAPYEDDAANMLRQQADRIAELEKFNKAILKKGGYPHKPLSDEEIMDIAEQSDYSPVEIEMGYDYEIRIARAIEERHGIK